MDFGTIVATQNKKLESGKYTFRMGEWQIKIKKLKSGHHGHVHKYEVVFGYFVDILIVFSF